MAYNYGGYMPVYPQYQQNQMPMMNNQMQMNQGNFIWTQGEAGARAFQVAPNQEVILMDSDNPVVYFKTADATGRPTLKIYDLVERKEEVKEEPKPEPIDLSEYVRKADIESIVADAVDKAMSSFTMTPTKAKRGASNA